VDPARRAALGHGTIPLDIEDLLSAIPHRPPNLLLDRVLTLIPGCHGVGIKTVTGDECGPTGLSAGFVFPSTFALEAMAQLASVVVTYPAARDGDEHDGPQYQLGSVHRLDVQREVVACGALGLNVTILDQTDRGVVTVEGHALISGEPCVDAEFQLVPFGNLDSASPSWRRPPGTPPS